MCSSYVCYWSSSINFIIMKHSNSNFSSVRFELPRTADGILDTISVDQFPVSDQCLRKSDGWPMNDVGILDRFSRDQNISQAEIDFIAGRLQVLKDNPRNDKSDAQLLRELKPAWCQTASEMIDFENAVYEVLESEKAEKLRETEDTTTTGTPVQSTPVQSTSGSSGSAQSE